MSNDYELHYCLGCGSYTYHSEMYTDGEGETYETDETGELDSVLVCEECGEMS